MMHQVARMMLRLCHMAAWESPVGAAAKASCMADEGRKTAAHVSNSDGSQDAHGMLHAVTAPIVQAAARQRRRYSRIFARQHYALRARLINATIAGEPKKVRAGLMTLVLLPEGKPYGWNILRFHLALNEPQGEAVPDITSLNIQISAPKGHQVRPMTAEGGGWHQAIVYLPPNTLGLTLWGQASCDGLVELSCASLCEISRQEARMRCLSPDLKISKLLRRPLKPKLSRARQVLADHGLGGLVAAARAYASRPTPATYVDWIARNDTRSADDVAAMQQRIKAMQSPPKISVIVPTYNSNLKALQACVASVQAQIYPHWELCIADDASPDPQVRVLLKQMARDDERIRLVFREQNGHISAASNSALQLSRYPWVALLDHDDLLSDHALYMVAEEIVAYPDTGLIYSDEDKAEIDGTRIEPYFKPNYSYDLLLSQNYISHLGVYKKSLVQEVGGFRSSLDGSQDYDLALRVCEQLRPDQIRHLPFILYHWRKIDGSASSSCDAKPYAHNAAQRAIQQHFERTQTNAYTRTSEVRGWFRTKFRLKDPCPHVTLIIPTRDRLDLLSRCIDSILVQTAYHPFDIIIVDNDSCEPKTLAYLAEISQRPDVSVVRAPGPFNYSAINNLAVKQAQGQVLAFVNNDIEATHADWLEEMVAHALRPGIGAVGAKLMLPDGTIQHVGVALGLGGVGAHYFAGTPDNHASYFGRASLTHNASAVTAACLVVQKKYFDQVLGFDETLTVAYNDVDLCLRIGKLGLAHVVTPYAKLMHKESASRGVETIGGNERFAQEQALMYRRWGKIIYLDPLYNPNLTHSDAYFSLAERTRVSWRDHLVSHDQLNNDATAAADVYAQPGLSTLQDNTDSQDMLHLRPRKVVSRRKFAPCSA